MKLVRQSAGVRCGCRGADNSAGAARRTEHGPVEPVVREILAEVRGGAMRHCGSMRQVRCLVKAKRLLVSREEMKAAWDATAPKLQEAMSIAQANIGRLPRRRYQRSGPSLPWMGSRRVRLSGRWKRRLLCAGRPLSASIDPVDDCDACAGCRGRENCGVLAEARAGDARGCVARRGDRVLPRRRCAGDCGDGVWNAIDLRGSIRSWVRAICL